jgi:hypothetical protein
MSTMITKTAAVEDLKRYFSGKVFTEAQILYHGRPDDDEAQEVALWFAGKSWTEIAEEGFESFPGISPSLLLFRQPEPCAYFSTATLAFTLSALF